MFPHLTDAYLIRRDPASWVQVTLGEGGGSALSVVREPPLSVGRGWAKDVVIWPQAGPSVPTPHGSDAIKLWWPPSSLVHFVSEASLMPP